MIRTFLTPFAIILGLTLTVPAFAADATPDKAAMEKIIHDYLMDHPEVIIESVQKFQERQQAEQSNRNKDLIASLNKTLAKDDNVPHTGNTKGDVTIIEFFDYNCGYCKKVFPMMQALVQEDKNIRYVFIELPILAESSRTGALAALAIWKIAPEKYFEFHAAMMSSRGGLNDEKIMSMIEKVGLDVAAIKKEMGNPAHDATLKSNHMLAESLGVNGTPAFIIGDELVPGALSEGHMLALVKKARS